MYVFKHDAYWPLRPAHISVSKDERSRLATAEIIAFLASHAPRPKSGLGVARWTCRVVEDIDAESHVSELFPIPPEPFRASLSVLSITAEWEADLAMMQTEPPLSPQHDTGQVRQGLAQSLAEDMLAEHFQLVAIAATIALPGHFELSEFAIVDESGHARWRDEGRASLPDIAGALHRVGWPTVRELSLGPTFEWLHNLVGAKELRGIGPVGRAIAALSHVIAPPQLENSMELTWALLGLEALYARSAADVQGQILSKSEVLLGPRTGHTKTYKEVYNLRSRLLHGDIDIPFAHSNMRNADDHYLELSAATALAAAILIATLQTLVALKRHDLEFHTVLAEPRSGS